MKKYHERRGGVNIYPHSVSSRERVAGSILPRIDAGSDAVEGYGKYINHPLIKSQRLISASRDAAL
jgi:hypothetical protein